MPATACRIAARTVGLALGAVTAVTAAVVSTAAGATAPPTDEWVPVAHEVVGALPPDVTTSLSPHVPVRIADADDLAWLRAELGTATTDPAVEAGNRQLLDVLDEAHADGLPPETVLVVGTAWGCDTEPGLVRHGDDVLIVDVSERLVMCVRAVPVVAVIAADADDVPVGSTDRAELVQFVTGTTVIDADRQGAAAAATLPPPAKDAARLSFLMTGCGAETAELRVTSTEVSAVLRGADGPVDLLCEAPLGYYVTFDIDRRLIPSDAEASTDPQ